jgi:hypothetical protein
VWQESCPDAKVVYVATNEPSVDELRAIQLAGFTVFSDVAGQLSPNPFNSLDTFLIELKLVCNSDYYFAWGTTIVHDIISVYCMKDDKVRFINDKRVRPPKLRKR